MSEKVGNVSYYDSTGQSDFSFSKPYSEKTAELIDSEVKVLIEGEYIRAMEVLKKNEVGHAKLANLLLEREVIFSEDLEDIFGKRPWDKKHVIPENGGSEKAELPEAIIEKAVDVATEPEIKQEDTPVTATESETKPEGKVSKAETPQKTPKPVPPADSKTLF